MTILDHIVLALPAIFADLLLVLAVVVVTAWAKNGFRFPVWAVILVGVFVLAAGVGGVVWGVQTSSYAGFSIAWFSLVSAAWGAAYAEELRVPYASIREDEGAATMETAQGANAAVAEGEPQQTGVSVTCFCVSMGN